MIKSTINVYQDKDGTYYYKENSPYSDHDKLIFENASSDAAFAAVQKMNRIKERVIISERDKRGNKPNPFGNKMPDGIRYLRFSSKRVINKL